MFLLDTNVLSELRKLRSARTAAEFLAWEKSVNADDCLISAMTIQELEVGILRMEGKDPRQGQVLREWFTNYVLEEFKHRTLPVTTEVARRSAVLLAAGDRSEADMLIAATAYVHRLTLVTRNVKHLSGMGVRIVNPWDHVPSEEPDQTK